MRPRYLLLISFAVVALDQASKLAVIRYVGMGSSVRVGRLLEINVLGNPGGAFGMLQSWAGALIFVSLVFVAGVVFFIFRRAAIPTALATALAFMLGGGVGNLVDRLRYGYVVDYIDVHFWPVFNLADASITVGLCFLAYHLLFRHPSRENAPEIGIERKD